jgi:uncharacterized coiled-coil protein SlyX
MAVPVLRILKEIAPLIVQAGSVAAGLRPSGKIDDRLERLEWQTAQAGEVLRSLAEQLHATAEELSRQAEAVAAAQKRMRVWLALSASALVASGAALIAVWTSGG